MKHLPTIKDLKGLRGFRFFFGCLGVSDLPFLFKSLKKSEKSHRQNIGGFRIPHIPMPGVCLRVLYSFRISDHQIMVVGGCPSGKVSVKISVSGWYQRRSPLMEGTVPHLLGSKLP